MLRFALQYLKAWKMSQSFGPKPSDSKVIAWILLTEAGFMFEKLTAETSKWTNLIAGWCTSTQELIICVFLRFAN